MSCLKCCFIVLLTLLAFAFAHTTPQTPDESSKKPLWNATWTDRLKRKLLTHYDKFARPTQHTKKTTVNIQLTIKHVEMEELKSVMTVHGWIKMAWTDEKLQWNESEWGNLGVLHIADHEIWQPDVVLYNSATGSTIDHYGNTHCLVYPNGEVLWVPPAQFLVFCDMDLRLWPFDTQTCHLTLGSWTYNGDQVDLYIDEVGSEVDLLNTHTEWQLEEVKSERVVKTYSCCTEPYIEIVYNVTLRRRSPAYSAIVITPATAIVLMTLAGFWLPPNAGEKILLSGCTAIIICLFLLYFSQKLPAMAGHTPLVVLFYSSSLHLVILSLVVSVVVLNLSRNYYTVPVPWWLQSLLLGWPGKILGLHHIVLQGPSMENRHGSSVGIEDASIDASSTGGNAGLTDDCRHILAQNSSSQRHRFDWIRLAIALDRVCFLLYCLLFIILAIVYSV